MSDYGRLLGHPVDDTTWNECIAEDIEEELHYWLLNESSYDNGGVTKEEKDACITKLKFLGYKDLPDTLQHKLIDRRIKHQEEIDFLVMQDNMS